MLAFIKDPKMLAENTSCEWSPRLSNPSVHACDFQSVRSRVDLQLRVRFPATVRMPLNLCSSISIYFGVFSYALHHLYTLSLLMHVTPVFFYNQYKPFAEWARQSLFNFSWYPSQMSLKLTESCVSSDWARQCSAASYVFFKQSS